MKKILFYVARIIITGFLLLLFINYVHYMYSNDLNNIIEGKIYDTVTPGEVILKDAASIQTIVPLNDGMYQLSIPFFVDTKGNAKDIIGSVHVLLYDRYNTQIFYEELPFWYFTLPSSYP